MFKFLTICFIAIVASASSKPHLLTTGVSYATPTIVAHPVVRQPVVPHAVVAHPAANTVVATVTPAYYPNYAASYATYPSYAAYPQLGGAAYFLRRV